VSGQRRFVVAEGLVVVLNQNMAIYFSNLAKLFVGSPTAFVRIAQASNWDFKSTEAN
jgi:hypothetical protein